MRRIAWLAAITIAVLWPGAAAGTPQAAKPAGITWGSVHFTDSGKLSSWLDRRGVRYRDWARRHPSGRYLLTHPAAPARAAAPTRRGATLLFPTADAPRSRLKASVLAFLFVAALLMMVSAAGGPLVRLAHLPLDPARLTTARWGAACGGVAVAIGTALAWWN